MSFVLGLTGSIGMGKSATADIFRRLGVPVHDADRLSTALSRARRAADRAGVSGDGDGWIGRSPKLGAMVLDRSRPDRQLEAIMHPLVRDAEIAFLRASRSAAPLVVLDIPLLFETGGEDRCDAHPGGDRAPDRGASRAGDEKARNVGGQIRGDPDMQLPDAEKRRHAHFIVDSSRSYHSAEAQIRSIVTCLSGRPADCARSRAWKFSGEG